MDVKDTIIVIVIILLSPLILYLRDQTYRNLYGKATIGEDLERLLRTLREWIQRRRERK